MATDLRKPHTKLVGSRVQASVRQSPDYVAVAAVSDRIGLATANRK